MRLPTQFKQTKRSVIAFLLAIASFSAIAQIDNLAEAQRLLKQGQHTQALGQADTYILAKPRDPQGRFVKGLILAEMRRNPEAIAVFKKLTEDFPELPEPYNNLAVLYAQDKQFERARTALEAAIKTHPSYSVAHENLGDVYAKLASQAYGKALQIDSGNPATQSKLALIRDLITTSAKSNGKAVEPIKSNTNSKLAASEMAKPIPAPPTSTPPPVQTALPAPPIATVATSAPAKAVESPAAVSNTANSEAIKAVQSWANAWEQKDVKSYLSHYAPDFQTPNKQPRKAWEEERKSRINKPGKIEVTAEKLEVTASSADKSTIRFRQHYKSANLKTSTGKTLVLTRHGNRWLIQQERVN